MLKIEGEFQKAIMAHDRAVALEPENPQFRVNRAVALLQAGAWERAWQDYEYRMDLAAVPGFDRSRALPTLAGGFRLAGRTVLALHEEGFGDTLQFLRYLPLLAELGARVVACVPRELVRMMRLVPGVAEVVSDPAALPPHDFVCPMFSLPRVFGTTVATIPPVPALAFDAAFPPRHGRAMTAGEEAPRPARRIGLVWAGQARPSAPDSARSIGGAPPDWRRSPRWPSCPA